MVIPKENNLIVKMSAAAFREAIKRIALMADDRSHAIQLEIKQDEIRITAQSPDEGEAVETIPAEYDGEEITIGFNSNYLLDYYRSSKTGPQSNGIKGRELANSHGTRRTNCSRARFDHHAYAHLGDLHTTTTKLIRNNKVGYLKLKSATFPSAG